jgi:hypothetical protein
MYIYYVYAYLRLSDNTPYYIGKGKGTRYKDRHSVSVPKDRSKIIFLETNLSNVGACALERRYIRWYGRKDTGNGILHNKTDGGEGVCGVKRSLTQETRNKISLAHKGKKRTPESIAKTVNSRMGYRHTPQTKEKIGKKHKGRKFSEEQKANLRNRPPLTEEQYIKMLENVRKSISLKMEMNLHYNKQKAKCPHCSKIGQDRAMKRWHFDNCKNKIIL